MVAATVVGVPTLLRFGQAGARSRARVGLSLPLTGVQAGVAGELLAGYQLAAAAGSARGTALDLLVEDDGAKAERTASNIRKFGLDGSVSAVSGIVGTPHAKLAIPEARSASIPVIGIRSGASELRDGGPWLYHLRASYESELAKMTAMLGRTAGRMTVVYSDDSFGRGTLAHLRKSAAQRQVEIVAAVAAQRDGSDVRDAVLKACDLSLGAQSLVILMITRPTVEALKTARAVGFYGPTFAMSFTAGSELLASGAGVVAGLGLVSAFPHPRMSQDSTAVAFRLGVKAVGRPELVESVTAFEGFVYGSALVAAFERCADKSREGLVRCLDAQPRLVIAGEELRFDASRVGRQFLEVMYFDRAGILRR